jgi:O-antigen/teichoic acid export membrane protein
LAVHSSRHFAWTFVGLSLPLVIAVAAIPPLVESIGPERFGFLALAWGLIGYAGALDLGIGRAVTQQLAALRLSNDPARVVRTFRSAIRITVIAGAAGFAALALAAVLGLPALLPAASIDATEVTVSCLLVAIALPAQAVSATYRGVNEAYSNFAGISVLRLFLGAANFGGPYLIALQTSDLRWLVSTIVVSRIMALLAYRHLAIRCLPVECRDAQLGPDSDTMRSLLRFGGWFSVSSVLGPIMVQADRFFVGALISVAAVTAYVLPFELVVQSMVVVGAVTTVLYPSFSAKVSDDPAAARALFNRWLFRVAGSMAVLYAAMLVAMPWVLHGWLGGKLSEDSVIVGRILCVGAFLNSIGAVCFAYLHANKEVRVTALAHVFELPIFLLALIVGIHFFGIAGAAGAWVLRVALDTGLLLTFVSMLHRNGCCSWTRK